MMGVTAGLMGLEDSEQWNNGSYRNDVCDGVLKAYHENRKAHTGWAADRFPAQQRLTCPMSWTTTHANGTVTDAHQEVEQWWKETSVRMRDMEVFGRDPREHDPDGI